ncbi:MAG: hypothetical protein HOY79_17110 [Streptomyces sp.]|nr:hypothetical protein [Streptomyces sp.]
MNSRTSTVTMAEERGPVRERPAAIRRLRVAAPVGWLPPQSIALVASTGWLPPQSIATSASTGRLPPDLPSAGGLCL